MRREEEIHKAAENFAFSDKWADENTDAKRIYTKKQLVDMGFPFTTNGDIVTPDQLNEDLKKYLKYQKQKFIARTLSWLHENIEHFVEVKQSLHSAYEEFHLTENFDKEFIKAMENGK